MENETTMQSQGERHPKQKTNSKHRCPVKSRLIDRKVSVAGTQRMKTRVERDEVREIGRRQIRTAGHCKEF